MLSDARLTTKTWHQFLDDFVDDAELAARFKAHHRISYADCFAAALAKVSNGEVVTGDKEFKAVEGKIKISWL